MKFIVSSPLLLKNIQAISGVISSANRLPILDNFLFELQGESLQISASDLETTMIVNVPVIKAEEEGKICIPNKILVNTLKTFSDIPITFNINEETLSIEISAGEGKYKITGQNGGDFPKLPLLDNSANFEIVSSVLAMAIDKTLFAAGIDELRPVMSGVYFELSPESITFVATDAHKLVRYCRRDAHADKAVSFIVPRKPLNLLKNVLTPIADTTVKVEYNTSNVSYTFDSTTLICRLIEGKYPNYDAVIPTENPNKLTVDRVQFLNSIKRVSIFSNQATYQVRFKINGMEMLISAEDYDYANEAKERLACQYEGDDMEIGFNSRFLIEMVNNIDTPNLVLEMSEPHRAGLLLPSENENKDEDLLMLVMPVMLNQ